jgi:hypothetical protein
MRCECGNKVEPGETFCEWCGPGAPCSFDIEIDGVSNGERIGTCAADGRPIFRSWFAGTVYHTTTNR